MNTVQTNVSAVRVFRAGAEITRSGRVTLEAGTNRIRIPGITFGAEADSIKLYFPEGISLSDLHFENGITDDDEKESLKIAERIEALNKQIEVKELQASLWKENGRFSAENEHKMQDVETYIEKLPERLNALHEGIQALNREIREAEKKKAEAERVENLMVITAELEAKETGTYPFNVVYQENTVSWDPVYEIHADGEGPVILKNRARIRQATGEVWENVKVSLLTNRPLNGTAPEIIPVWLNHVQPAPQTRSRNTFAKSAMMGGRGVMEMEEAAPLMAMMDTAALDRAETAEAEISSEDTMTEYILPGTKTIPDDRNGTMADLKEYRIDAEYRTVAVPKKDVRAYLTARIQTKDIPNEIGGRTSVYYKNIFTGETALSSHVTKETLDLPLGQEEGIRVSRTEKKRRTSEAMLKNQKTTEFEYELTITSNKTKDTVISVQDQIPVSMEKTITVEAKDTGGAVLDAESGILTWEITLAPKETKTLHIAYSISWPKDKPYYETTQSGNKYCPECGARVPAGQWFCPECGTQIL